MKKEMLYIDASSGISGDMFVAAMLDLGADQEFLQRALLSLPLTGFQTRVSRVQKAAIDCCDFAVLLDECIENHDHDMEYLHGHEYGHRHSDSHSHSHGHEHDHRHDGHGHSHTHEHMHRSLPDIWKILSAADLTEGARKWADRIFTVLAEAEAAVHGKTIDEVHFHEVGAVDSIVDIVAAAVCLDDLGIEDVIIPRISEGSGTVRTQHGILPVPVPAVTAISTAYNLPLHFTGLHGEFVTPTGAAIAAAVMTSVTMPDTFRIIRTGIGAGKREYELPGMLRIMRIEVNTGNEEESLRCPSDTIWKLETNLDDCTGEILGYVMERLFEAGARDVHYMPVFMKKNRPGWQLNVICDKEKVTLLEKIIFEETTTIGIRRIEMNRSVLDRLPGTADTCFGPVQTKKCRTGSVEKIYIEYESAASVARREQVPLAEVYRQAERAMREDREK